MCPGNYLVLPTLSPLSVMIGFLFFTVLSAWCKCKRLQVCGRRWRFHHRLVTLSYPPPAGVCTLTDGFICALISEALQFVCNEVFFLHSLHGEAAGLDICWPVMAWYGAPLHSEAHFWFELGWMWKAHTHSGSLPWLGLKPRFSW